MKLFSAVYRSRLAVVLRGSYKKVLGSLLHLAAQSAPSATARLASDFLLETLGLFQRTHSLCMTPICVHFSVVSAGLLKPFCLAAVLCVMTKATMRSASRAACSFLRTYQRVARFAQGECRIRIQRCAAPVCGHHPRSTPPSSLAITPHLRMCWYKT